MENKTPYEMLQEKILLLEKIQTRELSALKEQFHETTTSLKPGNLIRSTFRNTISKPDTGSAILDSGIGIASGFVAKKFLFGSSTNPVKKIIGGLLQFGISNIVYKNSLFIKAIGGTLVKRIFRKRKDIEQAI